jgi:ABC-type molybdate transport system permease subunit
MCETVGLIFSSAKNKQNQPKTLPNLLKVRLVFPPLVRGSPLVVLPGIKAAIGLPSFKELFFFVLEFTSFRFFVKFT